MRASRGLIAAILAIAWLGQSAAASPAPPTVAPTIDTIHHYELVVPPTMIAVSLPGETYDATRSTGVVATWKAPDGEPVLSISRTDGSARDAWRGRPAFFAGAR